MLTRKTTFLPGYDFRAEKNGTAHGMHINFSVGDQTGVVVFSIYTNWFPKHSKGEWDIIGQTVRGSYGWSLDTHTLFRANEYQCVNENCQYLDGQPCYSSSSGLLAKEIFMDFCTHGEEWLWESLENYHAEQVASAFDPGI